MQLGYVFDDAGNVDDGELSQTTFISSLLDLHVCPHLLLTLTKKTSQQEMLVVVGLYFRKLVTSKTYWHYQTP